MSSFGNLVTRIPWRSPVVMACSALVAVVVVVGVAAMPAEVYPGDPMTMREETRAILLHGELALSDTVAQTYVTVGEKGQYVVDNPRNGRSYSKYGTMAAVFYLVPMAAELLVEGRLPPFSSDHRVLYLNAFNILLSCLAALSLHRTARRFGAGPWIATAYVLACFYTTFLWNYLRAQNSELMQLVLFAWAITAFFDVLDRREGRPTAWPVTRLWLACTALVLMKVAYLPLGPLFAAALAIHRRRNEAYGWLSAFWREGLVHALPALCCVMAWGTINWIKFGAPWLTGYHAWRPEMHGFTGSLAESLPQLLFSVQWGFGFCFPVLLLALPWAAGWLRREPIRYGTIVAIALIYVALIGMLPFWTGQWCYGPRYWLFVLPFVSLPAVDSLRALSGGSRAARFGAVVVAAALGYSTWLQWQVNRWPFFAYYSLSTPLDSRATLAIGAFFSTQSYGRILAEMDRCRDDLSALDWWRDAKGRLDPEFVALYERHVRDAFAKSNLYWWR